MRRSLTAVWVLVLHAALIGILMAPRTPPSRRVLPLVSVRLDLPARPAATPRPGRRPHSARAALSLRNRGQTPIVPRRRVAALRAPLSAQAHVPPAIRWWAALRRAARAISARRASPVVTIGSPRADPFPQAPRRRSWDGWDEATTHRIQMLRSGGTAVMLNGHCAIDFEPFPIIGCALGKDLVPGDLFTPMRHRSAGGLP